MKNDSGYALLQRAFLQGLLALSLLAAWPASWAADALPSWRDGPTKQAIIKFVTSVTDTNAKTYVRPDDRIAVFDNDGTLWSEQPFYFQIYFMADQVRAAAPKHPEWQELPEFKALMARDMPALMKIGPKPVLELLAQANSGMTTDEYDKAIDDWLFFSRHPRFNRPYTDLVYQPMKELLRYLEMNFFKNFIVSGGGIEFMRVWSKKAYGIPPERVIGSVGEVKFEEKDGKPVLTKLPKLGFLDDGPGKPVGIYRNIGRQPIFAFGNSDGDLQMLQWTAAGKGPRFMGLVHHTDDKREWAYDRASHIGKLDKALDEAQAKGWVVVDMKKEWAKVYAFD
ncbi:MAG: haloacid dehalogenase-like hydrolase [Burkholderiaceae bacterium]|nr:haloacid dehalogenase-like hydrolase [Burkholderiaceae bacterium]